MVLSACFIVKSAHSYLVYLFVLQKFGILGLPDEPCEMTFYTSLVTLSQIAVRLEQTISSCNTASVNDTSSNSTVSPWNTTSINDTSSSSTCTSLELQTLSAVVGQVVTDACNYVS